MGRRQMKRMIRWESIIITLLGRGAGASGSGLLRVGAVSAMGDIGVDRLALPAGRLISFVIVAGLAGVLAAVLPGPAGRPPRRAGRDRPPVTDL